MASSIGGFTSYSAPPAEMSSSKISFDQKMMIDNNLNNYNE